LASYNKNKITTTIKAEALALGFSACGISKPVLLREQETYFQKWIENGYHADMSYMNKNIEKRCNPFILEPSVQSIVSLLLNYYTEKAQPENTYKIAKYAWGNDYHDVIKEKSIKLLAIIKEKTGANAHFFVDTAPVFERFWAQQSGLGWIGKNTNLISKKFGSYVFISELFLDVELDYDFSETNQCGNCTKCIDACPAGALEAPFLLNANKCISYLTIENKNEIPHFLKGKLQNQIFGCDICQNVCPMNKTKVSHCEEKFIPCKEFFQLNKNDFENLTEEQFKKLFYKTPVTRAKYTGLMRNIRFASEV